MNVEPVTLVGQHVRLEPLRESHDAAICERAFDPELWRVGVECLATPVDVTAAIGRMLAAQAAGTMLPFVTVDLASGTLVGGTRFMNIDRANRRVEIGGTWIAAPWQRTAVNTEAKYLMLHHAFEVWGCVRVEFKTDVLNTRSRNAILRLGAREEGILRRHIVTWTGRIRDSVYFSILDSEWPQVKDGLEAKLGRVRL